MNLMRILAASAVITISGTAWAQDDKPAAPAKIEKPAQPATDAKKDEKKKADVKPLRVGDKAPPIQVEKWVKGEPVTGFEKGKVYIVEFWATWCGPCIRAFPHLSELQKEYKDKGLTIIGTNIWEEQEYTDKTIDKVKTFVEKQGDKMAYTVAYDGAAKAMDTSYMKAAGRSGIPSAFIVNQDGVVAYIGHPGQMDEPLKQILAGKYDMKAAASKVEGEAAMRQFQTLFMQKQYDKAYTIAREGAEKYFNDDAEALNTIAWMILDTKGVENRDFDLAHKLAKRAVEITKEKDGMVMDTLALATFEKGDAAKAAELQKKAIELSKNDSRMDENGLKEMQDRLEKFEKAAQKK